MNQTSSLRTIDAYRLAKAPQWAGSYRQDRDRSGTPDAPPRAARSDATDGVVVPFRQRA